MLMGAAASELLEQAWGLLGDGQGDEWDNNPDYTRGVGELVGRCLGMPSPRALEYIRTHHYAMAEQRRLDAARPETAEAPYDGPRLRLTINGREGGVGTDTSFVLDDPPGGDETYTVVDDQDRAVFGILVQEGQITVGAWNAADEWIAGVEISAPPSNWVATEPAIRNY